MALYENLQEETAELEDLLPLIANGDQNAFREFYEKTKTSVYGFALSIIKNTHDAEDVTQSTYVSIYHNAKNYQNRGKAMAWVLTIAKNLCLEKMRKDKREESLPEFSDYTARFSEKMNFDEKLLVEFCLNSLKLNERKIVVLHVISGLRHREIAKLLDMPLGTVLSTYNRAINKIKKHLEGGKNSDQ
jgi:RNA polymerase sigma-70 factor (ECF subfamily)